MIIAGPGYVGQTYLPYASDIFFHGQLRYFIPTGFTPIELNSILDFPTYCYENKTPLPAIYWQFCSRYFVNSKSANEAINILEPLRASKNILVSALSYPRNIAAIGKAKQIMNEHPAIKQKILDAPLDIDFVSREVCSHLLFEVFLEKKGFEGVIQYLRQHSSVEQIRELIAAVIVNRLQFFGKLDKILLFEGYWTDILDELSFLREDQIKDFESHDVDVFSSRLLASILFPIYGRCDTLKKCKIVADLSKEKQEEIGLLIKECKAISTDMFLMPKKDKHLVRAKLSEVMEERILEPLSDLLEERMLEVRKFLIRSITSSGVIAALISMVTHPIPNFTTLGVSLAAGATSAGLSQLIERRSKKKNPTKFLITSLKKMKADSDALMKTIKAIPQLVASDLESQ